MGKLKTKSAVKKRFRIKGNAIVCKAVGKRHNLRKRATKLKKHKTGFAAISAYDVKSIVKISPYGLR